MKNALAGRAKRPHPVKARVLRWAVRVLRALPLSWARGIGAALGWLGYYVAAEARAVALQNLALAFPDQPAPTRRTLARACFGHGGALFGESGQVVEGSRASIEAGIGQVFGKSLLDDGYRSERPLIVLSPHLGNWEMLWLYLQLNYRAMAFYRQPKMAELADWLRRGRQRFGGRTLALDAAGLRACLHGLREGRVLILLPDQVPLADAGVFAPFFGQPAYTLTLLQRLVDKTDAQLLMASCVRVAGARFDVRFERYDGVGALTDPIAFAANLNRNLEHAIRCYPEQYQWHYKRYKVQPDGSSLHD